MSVDRASPKPAAHACPGRAWPAEQLLLTTIRGWAQAREEGVRPQSALGPLLATKTSSRAGALLLAWIQAVEAASLRPIEIRCPVCGGLSVDEQRLIVSCGIAATNMDLGAMLLKPILGDTQSVMMLARGVNLALADCGWKLPARFAHAEVPPAGRTGQTLH